MRDGAFVVIFGSKGGGVGGLGGGGGGFRLYVGVASWFRDLGGGACTAGGVVRVVCARGTVALASDLDGIWVVASGGDL